MVSKLDPMALTNSNSQSNASAIASFTFTTPVKLDRTNYTIWKQQVLSLVRGNGLESYIDGSNLCPDQFLSPGSEGTSSITEGHENP